MAMVDDEKFKCFVRYMINAAKQKRCVPYYEIENVFGLNHKQAGWYAGKLGDLCIYLKFPPLNGLVISSTACIPSHGFNWYQNTYGKPWGEIVQACWKKFHIKSSRAKQAQDFDGLDAIIGNFLEED
ncbi:MAG: hypothetical protein ACLQUW_01185 [Desulfobaccales bacterium]